MVGYHRVTSAVMHYSFMTRILQYNHILRLYRMTKLMQRQYPDANQQHIINRVRQGSDMLQVDGVIDLKLYQFGTMQGVAW